MTVNPAVAGSGRMVGLLVGGRYRLEQQLGRGGMASVWQAWDTRLDRGAAVKLLDPVWRDDPVVLERLRREAHAVAGLAHRHIVGVYDCDAAEDAAYLVMELVDGRSVSELLAEWGPLPVPQAVSIAAQVCDALGAAHAAGVVHRDIKPSNILVGAGGVKVCDFGIARLQRAAGQAALTGTGAVVGTCHYMAPEQATGERVDGRSDLYAVGCVLYMMLTGGPPFTGTNPMDVLDLHLHEPPVPLSAHRDDVPAALDQLVGELLAKHRADRPATAWTVRDRLAAIEARLAGSGDPHPPITPLPAGDEPTQLTLVSPIALAAAVTPSFEDTGSTGRHRSALAPAPVLGWAGRWLSGWVVLLVAAAVLTTVVAAIALVRGGGNPDTPVGAPPPATAFPDTEAPPADLAAPAGPSQPTPPPSASASPTAPTAAPTSPARSTSLDQITGLAAVLQQQVDTGQLKRKTARTLLRDLNEVARHLSAGETTEAAHTFSEFRERVTELRSNGELTGPLPDLDLIAKAIAAG
jgi:eukaryotic-like serine/threonine-protein kinase